MLSVALWHGEWAADSRCTRVFRASSVVEPRVLCLPLFPNVSIFSLEFFVLRCAIDIREVEHICWKITLSSHRTTHSIALPKEIFPESRHSPR